MPDFGIILAIFVYFGFYNNGADIYAPPPINELLRSYGNQHSEEMAKSTYLHKRVFLPQHRGQPYPFFLATQKTSLMVSENVSQLLLMETSIDCASAYLCANPLNTVYIEKGIVTGIDLEVTYIFLYVKKYEFKFYGIVDPKLGKP